MFFFCILWAVGYTVDYHWWSQHSQAAMYAAEMEEAAIRWPTAVADAAIDTSPGTVEAGKAIYAQNCVPCHGPDLHGGIGPNLTDDVWIHGGTFPEIRTTITEGVPAKGMITWGPILGPEKIGKVAAYVYTTSHPDGS
jgi:cytochrome c oxidase cbb3-type subunit 3